MKKYLKPLLACVSFLGIQLIVSIITTIMVAIILGNEFTSQLTIILIPTLIISSIISILFMKWPLNMLSFKQEITPSGISPIWNIIVLIASMLGIYSINLLTEFTELPNNLQDILPEMTKSVMGFFCIGILGPIAEEFIFRSAILGYMLRNGVNAKLAIIISALIFGIIHLNPAQIPYAFLIGVIFGVIYYKTRNIILTVILHIVINSSSSLAINIYSKEELNAKLYNEIGIVPEIAIIVVGLSICSYVLYRFCNTKQQSAE